MMYENFRGTVKRQWCWNIFPPASGAMDRQNKEKAPAYIRGALNPLPVWCIAQIGWD